MADVYIDRQMDGSAVVVKIGNVCVVDKCCLKAVCVGEDSGESLFG